MIDFKGSLMKIWKQHRIDNIDKIISNYKNLTISYLNLFNNNLKKKD
jgi:hypothetical protein